MSTAKEPAVEAIYVRVPGADSVDARRQIDSAIDALGLDWTVESERPVSVDGQSTAWTSFELTHEDPDSVPVGRSWQLARDVSETLGGGATAEPVLGLETDPTETGSPPQAVASRRDEAPPKNTTWHIDASKLAAAWELDPGEVERVRIGQLDTGISPHPELGSLDAAGPPHVVLYDDANLLEGGEPYDRFDAGAGRQPGHGTSTGAFIVASHSTSVSPYDLKGVAPRAELVPIRVVRSVVILANQSRLARGIDLAVSKGCKVISISLGGIPGPKLHDAVIAARAKGVIIVAAAGNWALDRWRSPFRFVVWPAAYPEVIATAAVGPDLEPWVGSARGKAVNITAPGHRVAAARWDGVPYPEPALAKPSSYYSSGTSYSTALVAGAAAMWLARHSDELAKRRLEGPLVTWAFDDCLRRSVGSTRLSADFGHGLIDCGELMRTELPADPPSSSSAPAALSRGIGTEHYAIDELASIVLGEEASGVRERDRARLSERLSEALPQPIKTDAPELRRVAGELRSTLLHDPGLLSGRAGGRFAMRAAPATTRGAIPETDQISEDLRNFLSGKVPRIAPPSGPVGSIWRPQQLAAELKLRMSLIETELARPSRWTRANDGLANAALLLNPQQSKLLAEAVKGALADARAALEANGAGLPAALQQLQYAERLMEFERAVRGQRLRPDDAMGLALAQQVAAAGHAAIRDAVDPTKRATLDVPPVVFVLPYDSPATLPQGVLAPEHFFGFGGRRKLPVHVVVLSSSDLDAAWQLPVVHHELGHDADTDYGLSKPIADALHDWSGNTGHWNGWVPEMVADAVGTVLGGPSFGLALVAALAARGLLDSVNPLTAEYPPGAVRILLIVKWLDMLGWRNDEELAEVLSRLEEAVRELPSVKNAPANHPLLQAAGHVAKLVLCTTQPRLGTEKSIHALAAPAKADAAVLRTLKDTIEALRESDYEEGFTTARRKLTPKLGAMGDSAWRLLPSAAQWALHGWMRDADPHAAMSDLLEPVELVQLALPASGYAANAAQTRFRQEAIRTLRPTRIEGDAKWRKVSSFGLFCNARKLTFVGATNDTLHAALSPGIRADGEEKHWEQIDVFFLSKAGLRALAAAEGKKGKKLKARIKQLEKTRDKALKKLRNLLPKVAKNHSLLEHDHAVLFASLADAEEEGGRIHVSAQAFGMDIKDSPGFDLVWVPGEKESARYRLYLDAVKRLRGMAREFGRTSSLR